MKPRFDSPGFEEETLRRERTAVAWLLMIVLSAVLSLFLQYRIFASLNSYFVAGPDSEARASLRRIVTLARNSVADLLSEVREGRSSAAAGRQAIRNRLRSMTYEDAYGPNYVFMSTYDGIVLVEPFIPSMELSNQMDLRDSNGLHIHRALVDAAVSRAEGGFVSYLYPPPGSDRPEEKLSYVVALPEIDSIIGTGIYVQAFSEARRELLQRARTGSVLLMIGTAIGFGALALALTSANRKLVKELLLLRDAERSLELSERNLKNVFDLLEEGVVVHDAAGRIVDCNQGLLRMLGITRSAALSSTVFDLAASGYDRNEASRMYEKLSGGAVSRFDWKSVRSTDGSEFIVEVVLKKGEWQGEGVFIAEVRDVTAKRHSESALLARKIELERFERLMVGRELKMVELKRRIAELEARLSAGERGSHG